jgi:hypothetical protein
MRTTSILFFTALLCFMSSQQVVANTYYPLALGNEWFYRSITSPPGDSTIWGVRVIGDTLLPNGHLYFVLNGNDIMGSRFVRTDSTSVFYPNPYTGQDQPVFKLNSQLGDTTTLNWGPYAFSRLAAVETLTVFGHQLRVLTFELDGLLYSVLKLCEMFGPMTEWRYSDPPPPWPDYGRELVGCTIGGIRYGRTLAVEAQPRLPGSFELYQNFPNPFNPTTNIVYSLKSRTTVLLRVLDICGSEVRTLVHGTEAPGVKTVRWDGRDNSGHRVSSGTYFYELRAEETRHVRRMILLK